MSQLQAAPAIGKAPPNPIFSADALKPLLQIGYQTPSSQLSFPERRLSAAGFAHSLSEPELTKKYNSKFLNLRSCSRPLTLSTFHAEHYWRPRVPRSASPPNAKYVPTLLRKRATSTRDTPLAKDLFGGTPNSHTRDGYAPRTSAPET